MSKFKLDAEVRAERGKERAKKLRAAGRFPAIVYGADGEAISLTLDTHTTELVLQRIHGEKILVDLFYDGKEDKVFVRNVQRDPVTEKLLHVDFFRVNPDREIETRVAVIGIGIPEGVKMGGLLEHGTRIVDIRCLPGDVPPHIEIDITKLQQGRSLHVSEMPPIKGVKVLTASNAVLFHVTGKPAAEETEEAQPATT